MYLFNCRLQGKHHFFQHNLIKDIKQDENITSEQLAAIVDKWSIKQSKKKSKKKKIENETNEDMEANEVPEISNGVQEQAVVPLGENSAAMLNENEQINLVSSSEESDLEIIEPPPPPKIGK